MPIRSISSSAAGSYEGATGVDPGKPVGTQATDVLIAQISCSASAAPFTAPSGWTLIGNGNRGASYWALGSVASTLFNFTGTWEAAVEIVALSGRNTSSPITASSIKMGSVGDYGFAYGISVSSAAGDDVIALYTSQFNMTDTGPSGYTEGAYVNLGANKRSSICYKENVTAGATGSLDRPVSGTYGDHNVAIVSVAMSAGPTVTSVTQTSGGTEGSPAVMTVALSGATSGSTNFAATLAGVTATGSGTDFTSNLASATYSNGVTFSGGNMVVPDAVSGWTVTIATTGDMLDEANETATLTIGGTAGTLTITDDDAAPTITGTASSTVTAGDPVVITYSPGLSGQTRTYTLALTDGTAVGGTDYDNTTVTGDFAVTAGTGSVSISGSTVTVDPGVTEFTLSIGTTA